jgi:hypothetical protein
MCNKKDNDNHNVDVLNKNVCLLYTVRFSDFYKIEYPLVINKQENCLNS